MAEAGNYILSVTASAVIVAIITAMVDEKQTSGALARTAGGMFLACVVLSPVARWDFDVVAKHLDTFEKKGLDAALTGEKMSEAARGEIITQKTGAYILDKAEELGISVCVDVVLSDDEFQIPHTVYLEGAASPYARKKLQQFMESQLGIPKERQIWTG